jgi:hypothetical protein
MAVITPVPTHPGERSSGAEPAGRRRRPRLLAVGAVAVVAVLLAACNNVTVQASTLTAVDAQEESWYSNGDEPYVAVIRFRVKPGVAGSTQVQFLGNLQEIAQDIDDGDVASIPAAMGATTFTDVTPIGIQAVLGGSSPEIVGAVTVAMESDASPWSAINGIMNDVRAELDTQLRAQVETMTLADLLDSETAAARLEVAAERVEAAATPSFWRGVGIWFSSFGDPDDVIGFKVLFFVAVNGELADAVDAQLASGLPAEVVGRALRSGPLDVTYAGDGATYRVRWNVAITPA